MATTTNYSWNLPTVGGNQDQWGDLLNANWTALDTLLGGVNATELAILDGATVTTAELNKLDGLTATTAELNKVDGVTWSLTSLNGLTATVTEINKLDGFTGTVTDLNYAKDLRATGVTSTEFDYLDGVTSNVQTQLNSLSSSISSLNSIPSGGIILWSGSTASIPSGWYLCNGANGTPDLRDRFVVGAGSSYGVGATGGAASVALSTSNLPSHSYTFSGTTSTGGSHQHSTLVSYEGSFGTISSGTAGIYGGSGFGARDATSSNGSHSHTFSGTTSSTGSGTAHENRPPYYALAYIMKA